MDRPQEDNEMTCALRQGLQAQPVPQPGSDFDERVLAALRARRPWWQSLWFCARPIVSAAACSMVAMLALLHFSAQPSRSVAQPAQNTAPPAAQATITMAALDKALDRPGLRFGSLAFLVERQSPNTSEARRQPPHFAPARPSEPRRRDGLAPHREALFA